MDVRVGLAIDTVQQLIASGAEPFDLVFIDADKPSNPAYLEAALALSHPGTVIVGDNVVRNGDVVDADSPGSAGPGGAQLPQHDGHLRPPRRHRDPDRRDQGLDGFALAIVRSVKPTSGGRRR